MSKLINDGLRIHRYILAALEHDFDRLALGAVHLYTEAPPVDLATRVAISNLTIMRRNLASLRPIIWSDDIWDMASHGRDAFIGTPAPDLASNDHALWIKPGGIEVHEAMVARGVPTRSLMAAFYTLPSRSGAELPRDGRGVGVIGLAFFCFTPSPTDRSLKLTIAFGGAGECGAPITTGGQLWWYARHKFLTLPFIDAGVVPHHRSDRRTANRSGRHLPAVHVVSLRKRATECASGGTSNAASSVDSTATRQEYHHQWMVSGHWRRQWYPARAVHEAIWIDPYIKGPDDKPLLTHRPTVYQAVR